MREKITDILPQNRKINKSETIMDVQRKSVNSQEKIDKGLEKECASIGKTIDKSHGGVAFMEELSNIGGGAVREGFSTVNENSAARVILQTQQKKNAIKKDE